MTEDEQRTWRWAATGPASTTGPTASTASSSANRLPSAIQDHIRHYDLPFDGYRLEPFFDRYPGTLDGAEPNVADSGSPAERGLILIKPEGIVNIDDSMAEVDDPLG